MSTLNALGELAVRAGIEPEYYDVWGTRHELSADTKRTFLNAMGIPAATEEAIAQNLAAFEIKPWARALEPVFVIYEGHQEAPINIVCDAQRAGPVAWRLTAEDGTQCEGSLSIGDMPLGETKIVQGRHLERRRLVLPAVRSLGYYRLEATGDALLSGSGTTVLIVAPREAYLPDKLKHGRGIWGFALQLYALQGLRSWGLGDFGDLAGFVTKTAGLGVDALGVNPLHALFPGNPAHASPYSPSSRLFLNPLYIDIESAGDFDRSDSATTIADSSALSPSALRNGSLVDYVKIAAAKMSALERLYSTFCRNHLGHGTVRAQAFRKFQDEGGTALARYATFEALAEHFRGGRLGHYRWADWPQRYRNPDSLEITAFACDHSSRVTFYQYLQWEADRQLGTVSRACRENGMSVGLYRDLALGFDADGADAWTNQGLIAQGISIGAPPDPFNLAGQSWGLPPFSPHALRDAAYRPFVECLRANMRHAGALRIDHIMGFARLFWIPSGASPAEGGYVRYPLDDLLAITALESQRARCLIVGEDLGTVPEGLRERLKATGILSTRLLYFERDADAFRPAGAYPQLAHVAIGTHDLPTFSGYWHEHDITVRAILHQLGDANVAARLRQERDRARHALLAVFREAGLLPPDSQSDDHPDIPMEALVDAAYRFLATSPARLLMVQLEDVLGLEDQPNLPGTFDEHPNWRRKLPLSWEEIATSPRLHNFAEMLTRIRPR